MQNLPRLELAQRALRARVCTGCFLRPQGSETLSPDTPRSCEPGCQVFENLPELLLIAHKVHEPTMAPYEHAMREVICQTCAASPTAGDFCSERTTANCPLARYSAMVIETLESLQRRH